MVDVIEELPRLASPCCNAQEHVLWEEGWEGGISVLCVQHVRVKASVGWATGLEVKGPS